MTIPVPITLMLDLPALVVSGCEGGIEIVMLSSLPEDDPAAEEPSRPAPAPPDLN